MEQTLTTKTQASGLKGTGYVLLSAICFSLGGILIKLIPWSSLSINAVRSLLSFLVIFAFQKSIGHKFHINKMILLGGVLNFVMGLTFVMATKMTTAANAIVLQFTEPVFLILFVLLFYRQKPKKDAVWTCVLVLCGIFCFFFESLSLGGMTGNILALISGMSYAGVFLMKKFPGGDFESSLLISHVLSVLAGFPAFVRETQFSASIWAAVLVLGVVQFGLSYVFLSKGLDRVTPVTASLTSTIEPILNPVLVALFYGEKVGALAIFGALLVIGSATVYNVRQQREAKVPEPV